MPLTTLDTAHTATCQLVALFEANAAHYSSSSYQEAEVRKDFLDKFFVALGWDVNHDTQTNPYEQEVKIEKPVKTGESKRRADYAFYLAPQFRNPVFLVEAKRVQHDLGTPQNYFQAIRYSWNHQLPFVVLSDFRTFHLIDSRYKPDITSALQQKIVVYTLADYLDRDKFAEIYWIFSREAVADGSITKRSRELGAPNTTARQLTLFAKGFQPIDEVFLEQLDQYRSTLAYSFKALNTHLTGEQLTEAVQRTLDRLVFIRFLEDKQIEPNAIVSTFGSKRSPWKDFVAESKRLDAIYNGVVFKSHALIDAPNFSVDEHEFLQICDELSNQHSPYDFNSIPIEILGRIYERFLGKIISASATKATVEDKLSVQRAGGVYYTPDHIVQYMVDNSLGPQTKNKSADDILKLRIIDTSCGSGSFLIGVFDRLIRDVTKYFIEHPTTVKHGDTIERDGSVHLSLKKKREILLGCIYGIDIDAQAVEVAQLSLYLKLLEEESGHFRKGQREIKDAALLPSLNKNILVGNSLVSPSTQRSTEGLFDFALYEASKAIDIAGAFPKIMKDNDGFDLVIGNPPYIKEYVNRDAFTYVRNSAYYQGKMDIWYLFACRGLDLLRPNGMLAFIATNNWGTAFGAKLLRAKIAKDARIDQLIDFGNFKVFKNASIQTMILIARCNAKGSSYKFDYRYLNGRAPDRHQLIELLRRRPGDNLSYLSPRFDRTALSNSFFTF